VHCQRLGLIWFVVGSLYLGTAACGSSQSAGEGGAKTGEEPSFGGACSERSTSRGFTLADTAPQGAALTVRSFLDSLSSPTSICPGDQLVDGDQVYFEVSASESLQLIVVVVGSDGGVAQVPGPEPVELGPDNGLRLPDTDTYQLAGVTGTENVVLIASRGALAEADPELAAALAAVVDKSRAPGVSPPVHPANDSPLRTRGSIHVVAEDHVVYAVPDERGVIVAPLWIEHAAMRSRGISMH
jgi:hypothetical protein